MCFDFRWLCHIFRGSRLFWYVTALPIILTSSENQSSTSIVGDMSDELISLLRKLKTIVPVNARRIVQGLIEVTKNIQTAANNNNLEAAKGFLQEGSDLVAALLPKLTSKKIHHVYSKVLTKNRKLNRELASGRGSFDSIVTFLKFIIKKLGKALRK